MALDNQETRKGRNAFPAIVLRSAAVLFASTYAPAGHAETLADAFAFAYQHSPLLGAERASMRVSREDIAEEQAVGRPKANLISNHTEDLEQAIPSQFTPDRTARSDFTVTVPLYRGGAVRNAVRDARLRYKAAGEDFNAATLDLLNRVAVAYSDIIRDQAVLQFNKQNVEVLSQTVRVVRGRFRIGDVTITDVSQAEARLNLAMGNLKLAEAQLVASREEFVRVVGREAGILERPQISENLPSTVDDAVRLAIKGSNIVKAAQYRAEATEYRIKAAQAERYPKLSAVGSVNYFNYLNSITGLPFRPINDGFAARVGVTLDIPLYQGGLPGSRVRRARAEGVEAFEIATALERDVISRVRTSYAAWRLALAFGADATAAIAANERALKGARAEYEVGMRTVLEVLDLERELLNSRVASATGERNAFVASFVLLTAMGLSDFRAFGIVERADPAFGPPRPGGSWNDWADGRRVLPTGTSTVDSKAQRAVAD